MNDVCVLCGDPVDRVTENRVVSTSVDFKITYPFAYGDRQHRETNRQESVIRVHNDCAATAEGSERIGRLIEAWIVLNVRRMTK